MFERVAGDIICSEFECTFGNSGLLNNKAMMVRFYLNPDWDVEHGYRHLTILIYGDESKNVGVFAKLGWNVIPVDDLDGDDLIKSGKDYTRGETPWVIKGYHDSDWKDSVKSILWNYRSRINSIETLHCGENGWFKEVILNEEQLVELSKLHDWESFRYIPPSLEELEFKFVSNSQGGNV